jgi:hypothetical protein
MEHEGSFPCTQEPTTGRHPDVPSHSIAIRLLFNIILIFMPRFLNSLNPEGFPAKIVYAFLILFMHATCPAHAILFDMITTRGDEDELQTSSLCNFLHLIS